MVQRNYRRSERCVVMAAVGDMVDRTVWWSSGLPPWTATEPAHSRISAPRIRGHFSTLCALRIYVLL